MKLKEFRKQLKFFQNSQVQGTVVKLKDITRGFYLVYIKQGTLVTEYNLPNFKQYKDKVQVGDSLYKPAHSMVFQLHKRSEKALYTVEHFEIDTKKELPLELSI